MEPTETAAETLLIGVVARRLARQGLNRPTVARLRAVLEAVIEQARQPARLPDGPVVQLAARDVTVGIQQEPTCLAIVAAIRLDADGARALIGLDVGPSADGRFWQGFLQRLARQGLGEAPLIALGEHPRLREFVGE